jgi:hypothetical protein
MPGSTSARGNSATLRDSDFRLRMSGRNRRKLTEETDERTLRMLQHLLTEEGAKLARPLAQIRIRAPRMRGREGRRVGGCQPALAKFAVAYWPLAWPLAALLLSSGS